jgi:hypothetical protein
VLLLACTMTAELQQYSVCACFEVSVGDGAVFCDYVNTDMLTLLAGGNDADKQVVQFATRAECLLAAHHAALFTHNNRCWLLSATPMMVSNDLGWAEFFLFCSVPMPS